MGIVEVVARDAEASRQHLSNGYQQAHEVAPQTTYEGISLHASNKPISYTKSSNVRSCNAIIASFHPDDTPQATQHSVSQVGRHRELRRSYAKMRS